MKALRKDLRNGDETAFANLYESLKHGLYRYVFCQLGNAHDTSDVMQNTFIRLVKSQHALGKANNIQSYVYKVARNETIRFLKRRIRNRTEDKEVDSISQTMDSGAEFSDWITHVFSPLSETDREVVRLKVFSEMTFREIGEVLNLPESNVTSRYRRSLGKIESLIPMNCEAK